MTFIPLDAQLLSSSIANARAIVLKKSCKCKSKQRQSYLFGNAGVLEGEFPPSTYQIIPILGRAAK